MITCLLLAKTLHSTLRLDLVVPAPNKLSSSQAILRLAKERDPFWIAAKQEVDKSEDEILAQDSAESRTSGLRLHVVRLNGRAKEVALTFDDGPHPKFTPKLLDLLDRLDVKASFFLVGSQAEQNPELVRDIEARGHTIGNHTYHHVSLPKIPLEFAAEEVKACGDVIRAITGHAPRFFRPPGGDYTKAIGHMVNRLGYDLALWTDNSGDYEAKSDKRVVQKVLSRMAPGGVILMHDGPAVTLKALHPIVEKLKEEGYRFVTLDQVEAEQASLRSTARHSRSQAIPAGRGRDASPR